MVNKMCHFSLSVYRPVMCQRWRLSELCISSDVYFMQSDCGYVLIKQSISKDSILEHLSRCTHFTSICQQTELVDSEISPKWFPSCDHFVHNCTSTFRQHHKASQSCKVILWIFSYVLQTFLTIADQLAFSLELIQTNNYHYMLFLLTQNNPENGNSILGNLLDECIHVFCSCMDTD